MKASNKKVRLPSTPQIDKKGIETFDLQPTSMPTSDMTFGMTPRTKKRMQEINASIPQEWKDGLMKKMVDTEQEDIVKESLKDPNMSEVTRTALQKQVEEGVYRKNIEVVDEEVRQKIDDYLTKAVEDAFTNDEIDKPDPNDPFIMKMQEAAQRQLDKQAAIKPVEVIPQSITIKVPKNNRD